MKAEINKIKPKLTLVLLALPLCGLGQGAMGITDSRTGYSWLPLTSTAGIPENQVLSLYPACHIASRSDVLTLWADAGISTTGGGFFDGTTNNWPSLFKFMGAMGSTRSQDGHPETFGQYEGGNVACIDFLYVNAVPMYSIGTDNLWWNPTISWASGGTYIYTLVPEPSVFALCLLGLLTLKYRKP